MRITFVLPCYPWRPSGAFRVAYEYANNLVARGHEVSVVHARCVKDRNGFFAAHGLYQHLRRQAGSLRDVLLVPKVCWQAIDDRVRLLYVGEPTTASVPDGDAVVAATWDTVQYVCQYPRSKGAKFHLVQAYEYWSHLEDHIDAVWHSDMNKIVISRWLGEKMAELGCNEFSYIPNGINQSKFCLVNPIAGRPKRVAMLYAAAKWKGSADGLHALSIVKRSHPDLRAVLFGTTKKPRDLPNWVEYFRNPFPSDHVHNVYNGSSIYLCPSIREGWALPPAEAMACGCALVTADCLGVREYAEDEVNALFSPPREPESLAHNLLRVLDDETLRFRLASNGHARIQEFSWERSTAKLESVLAERIPSAKLPRTATDTERVDRRHNYAEA